MKVNELRVGNLVELPSFNGTGENIVADLSYHVFTVNVMVIRDAEYYGDDWAGRAIPLTEEWLVRFGLERGLEIVKGVRLWENRVVGGNGWFEGYKVINKVCKKFYFS